MNKLLITISFFVMLLAQWLVPGQMIYQQEDVLETGTAYKFKTRPIDPSDPFRGKYITLNYELRSFAHKDSIMEFNEKVYVYIKKDSLGFAEATHVSNHALDTNQDYVIAEFSYNGEFITWFNLPFNRYYMEETKAYDAELAVRANQRNRDSLTPVCYSLVYVKGDTAVLDDVFIGETSIKDFVEKE